MKALIIGCKGQDGSYLAEQLTAAGLEVFGLDVAGLYDPDGRLCGEVALDNAPAVADMVNKLRPGRVFYLAAYHRSSEEHQAEGALLIERSFAVHVVGLGNVLAALAAHAPAGRLFYAASSHVFGNPSASPQDENIPLAPTCVYGISKAAGVGLCRMFRRDTGLFCSVGFLYNHESPRRERKFLSRKIAASAVEIEQGLREKLVLADLDARVDWGFAPEYTDAMVRILQLDSPDDFVIATGRLHSVRDFLEAVFGYVGLDWSKYVTVDPSLVRKARRSVPLVGAPARLKAATGWEPKTTLGELAKIMVDAERAAVRSAASRPESRRT